MTSNKSWRKVIWQKSSGVCAHCGKQVNSHHQTVEHAIPQILGGGNDSRNLMPLCKQCNKSRASGEIIPETYYKYAHQWALDDLHSYIFEWKKQHTCADGTLIGERFGIIEKRES